MKNLSVIIVCLSLMISSVINAQDFKADIEKMKKAYEISSFQTNMEIRMEVDGKNWMTKKASVKKDENRYWYRMDATEMLFNEKYSVMVDHGRKSIVFSQLKKGEKRFSTSTEELLLQEGEMIADLDNWKFIDANNGMKHYQKLDDKASIKQVDIYLSKENYTISKMEYEYNQKLNGGKKLNVEIFYKKTKLNPSFNDTVFSEKNFFIKKDKNWKSSASLTGYTVKEIEEL